VSWVPTIKIARAAWRGRRDPAGLLKAQLAPDESPAAAAQLSAAVASAPAGAALPQPAAVIVSEPLAQAHEDPTHHHLLLLLR
jgi:hypothetical protein